MSEWQIPQNLMSIRTSFGPRARRSISSGPSGASGVKAPTARAVVVREGVAVNEVVDMTLTVRPHKAPKGGLRAPLSRLRGVDRRAEIRDFLISRRAKVSPEAAGLYVIEGDRPRRVPGLRREEVADLAGLSVDY